MITADFDLVEDSTLGSYMSVAASCSSDEAECSFGRAPAMRNGHNITRTNPEQLNHAGKITSRRIPHPLNKSP